MSRAPALPRATPEAQGVDPGAVRAMVEAWEAADVRPSALAVVRHGAVVAEATWAPYAPTDRLQKYSLSKTFTASAVGLAVAEGLLAVTDTAASFFPELTGLGPRARAITVANLLSMASGHTHDVDRLDPADPVGTFLRTEPERDPGSVFQYNQGCTFTLSAIVQRVTGEPLHRYLRPRLLDPLGIDELSWVPIGDVDQGYSGLHVTCEAVARLGVTLLDRGRFGGRQVLDPAWVAQAMTVHVPTAEPSVDWQQGYGYQMWRSTHGWRGDGAFGQLCLVLPEHDLVVAATAQTGDIQTELDAIWEYLLPGMHDAPLPPGEDLVEFLATRSLPTLAGGAPAPAGRHVLRATGDAARHLARGGTVNVEGTVVELDDGSARLGVALGDDRWERTSGSAAGVHDFAGTGGWVAEDVLVARLAPLHSPHVAELRADLSAGTAELTWQTEPLGLVGLTDRTR